MVVIYFQKSDTKCVFVELVTPYNQVSTLNPTNVDVNRFSLCK